MPARRRTLSPPSADLRLSLSDEPPASAPHSGPEDCGEHGDEEKQPPTQQRNDSDDRCSGSQSACEEDEDSEAENEEFILVQLEHIRKEVQCPICLGIIMKTRTVMECLHRFCRECIDKSMRLGNNECPACRTHCASRRSLRDDPNFDALIAALYPDIEKYEEEELALHEDEKTYYKKMQADIAETYRRQSEALGRKRTTTKDAITCGRKPQESYRITKRKRGRVVGRNTGAAGSDYIEEEEAQDNDGTKASSSVDEPSPKPRLKRCKRWTLPSSTVTRANVGIENDVQVNEEPLGSSDLQAGNREMFAWGKNGTRSQSRHGNTSGSNDKLIRGGRTTKLVDYLSKLEEADEFDVHLTLVPLDEESMPNLKQPHLCCRPTLSIRHLCQFIALETSMHAEEVEICTRRPQDGNPEGLQILDGQESLATVNASFAGERGELVLGYCQKLQS